MNITLVQEAFGAATFTPDDVARLLDVRHANNQILRWKQQGLVERVGRGRYRIARRPPPGATPTTTRRDPPKQRLLADLARRRWKAWRDTKRVEPTGPRSFRYRVQDEEAPHVRIRRL